MSRALKPHGTIGAYGRHMRRGEKPCDACLTAWAEYHREWHAKNKDAVNARRRARRAWLRDGSS